MSAQVSINPVLTTNAAGSFARDSVGYIQGTALNDPSVRNWLSGGVLAPDETLPMWGGVGIYEDVPTPYSPTVANSRQSALGGNIGRATALTGSKQLTGFSVFDQNIAAIVSPQSQVPLLGTGMGVHFYRLGSQARIAVKADPGLISLQGGIVTPQVSWDFVNQILVPYLGTLTISSGTYVSATGVVTLTMSAAVTFSPGDAIVVSSLTGTGAFASLNGTYTALTASGTTVTYQGPVAAGAATITGGSLTLGSGASSALPVRVLDVQADGNMTVSYDPVTNFANWNRSGPAAIILI